MTWPDARTSHSQITALADRVETARTRIDELLASTAEEPPAPEVLRILIGNDVIGADESELTGALWVILTTLGEALTTLGEALTALAELRAAADAQPLAERARLLRAAEEAARADVARARVLLEIAEAWGTP